MRSLIIPGLMLLAACSTPRGLDPARLPANIDMELETEIQSDLNSDKIEDAVKIMAPSANSNFHVLHISLSDKNKSQTYENNHLVYSLSKPGASLEMLENGSFKVIIDHSAAGPSASLREYTISYRDGSFLVSGITVSEYDRNDPEIGGSCDINLLTGDGERNSKPIKIKGMKLELASAKFDWLPNECKF
ncbi:MAG: hypothetical protein V4598_12615 [Bdellovibrionota bacterium]